MESISMVKQTRQSKLKTLAGKFAVIAAKANKDPLFKKYKVSREKYMAAKKAISKKYGNKGLLAAKNAAAASDNK